MWCFTLSKFLNNEDLLQYFPLHLLLEHVMFEYILYSIYFIVLPTRFIYIKSFFIAINIFFFCWYCQWLGWVLFSFLLKLNSHYPHTFTSPFQKTLKQNHPASHNWYSVKNMLQPFATVSIQKAFKWVIAWNRMIGGHVNLVVCFN